MIICIELNFNWMFIYSWKQLNNRNNLNMNKYEFQEQEEQEEAYGAWLRKCGTKSFFECVMSQFGNSLNAKTDKRQFQSFKVSPSSNRAK